jgi:LPXTG-site transpeptidase (sortase) family protein
MSRIAGVILFSTIGAVAAVLFVATMARAVLYAPDSEMNTVADTVPTSVSDPARLIIPALDIDAVVQHVGRNAKGSMAVPTNYTDVGWYRQGPRPGQSGSAVIDGHVNNGLGLSGVFERLHELKAGDDVYVRREDGTRIHFVVTGSRSYPYTEAPTEVIFNPAGSERLNLITCDGDWLPEAKTYDERLVVFTKLSDT